MSYMNSNLKLTFNFYSILIINMIFYFYCFFGIRNLFVNKYLLWVYLLLVSIILEKVLSILDTYVIGILMDLRYKN